MFAANLQPYGSTLHREFRDITATKDISPSCCITPYSKEVLSSCLLIQSSPVITRSFLKYSQQTLHKSPWRRNILWQSDLRYLFLLCCLRYCAILDRAITGVFIIRGWNTNDVVDGVHVFLFRAVSVVIMSGNYSREIPEIIQWRMYGFKKVSSATVQHYDVIKWKHFTRYCSFVRGIHRSPEDSPHKGTITRTFENIVFSGMRILHHKDKTVVRPSHLYNGSYILVRRYLHFETAPSEAALDSILSIHEHPLYRSVRPEEAVLSF